ncbi:unnamed protein product [Larinioides sclopetarius]|uniref:Uncharacterized protein n=1 Tax=Larinioides sclopetarius TaxID=280406 RepID=A0AAV2ALR6_9ARAC
MLIKKLRKMYEDIFFALSILLNGRSLRHAAYFQVCIKCFKNTRLKLF